MIIMNFSEKAPWILDRSMELFLKIDFKRGGLNKFIANPHFAGGY